MRAFLTAAILMLCSCAAQAWEVNTGTDRLTDKKETWIRVNAPPILRLGKSVMPYIEVQCYKGKVLPQFHFDKPVDFGRVGINFRFDQGKVKQLYIAFFNDGMTFPIFSGDEYAINAKLKNGKRLRMEIFFTGQEAVFIDFDLTGGKEAYSKLKC